MSFFLKKLILNKQVFSLFNIFKFYNFAFGTMKWVWCHLFFLKMQICTYIIKHYSVTDILYCKNKKQQEQSINTRVHYKIKINKGLEASQRQ